MKDFLMNEFVQLAIRLLTAALLGAAIGYEREFRGKGAGVRTHVLVSMGACLFMLISKYGFGDSIRFDAARVAAGVVSGIGFLGGGLIIKSKATVITGLTTAAGLWVAAAIGLACGAGMYIVALAATLLTIICLETLNFIHARYDMKRVTLTLAADREEDIIGVLEALKKDKIVVESYTVSDGKVHIILKMKQKNYLESIKTILSRLEGFQVEDLV